MGKIPLLYYSWAPRLLCALSLRLLSRNVTFRATCDCSSRTLEFAPHALPHIFDFTCLLTTTSDSSIVRAVGVEPTILTTIGIRLLSMARLTRSLFFHTVVDFSPARTYCRFPDSTEFRLDSTKLRLPQLATLAARTCCFECKFSLLLPSFGLERYVPTLP